MRSLYRLLQNNKHEKGRIMTVNQIIISTVTALICSAVLTGLLIPYFKKKQFGQYIREEGPEAHKAKSGTPTMGGIAFIIAIAVGILATGVDADKIAIILTMIAFGAVGFIDDYNKIAKKNNLGITPKQKIALQVLFSVGIAAYMMIPGRTLIMIPFFKISMSLGILYLPFIVFVEVAMTNSVNLTDGLDGLASSVTVIVALCFAAVGAKIGHPTLVIAGVAVAGALLGFLIFNKNPAKVFMGDTGSMALGGVLSGMAIVSGTEFLLPIAGLIYVFEALSVIIQVQYFRKTGGKRFFRMAPLHHHFELGGMNEVQVVAMFSLFTLAVSAIGYFVIR